ncbi:hypothetical protein [Mycobacterium sp. P7213]|uniref:hypothetical protein n=1 Tax=Mycobacterium sp. P7213 TaxID=2478465 RepID=UPI000F638C43|nr:hypothetical protein [Mycobacterium sp. P7213]
MTDHHSAEQRRSSRRCRIQWHALGAVAVLSAFLAFGATPLTTVSTARADDGPHWGQNEKYERASIPIVNSFEQRVHVCGSLDYYGVRSDVLKGIHSELVSWGRSPSQAKAIMDAALVEMCPEYLDEYTALSRTPVLGR